MSKNRELDNDGVDTVDYTLENIITFPLYTKMEIFIKPPTTKVNNKHFNFIKLIEIFQKTKSWFEKLSKGFRDTQNNFVNRLVEKFNEMGEDAVNQDEINKMKVYY